jgi:hypothetical protein
MTTYTENSELNAHSYSLARSDFAEGLRSDAVQDDLLAAQEDCEEVLIADQRANLGPAALVEHKLSTLLGGACLPVSHMRVQPLLGSRSHC